MHEESTKFYQPTTMAVIHKSYKKYHGVTMVKKIRVTMIFFCSKL